MLSSMGMEGVPVKDSGRLQNAGKKGGNEGSK